MNDVIKRDGRREAFDSKKQVTVRVSGDYSRAYFCDLLENEERELPLEDRAVTLPVKNFEIVTLKFVK